MTEKIRLKIFAGILSFPVAVESFNFRRIFNVVLLRMQREPSSSDSQFPRKGQSITSSGSWAFEAKVFAKRFAVCLLSVTHTASSRNGEIEVTFARLCRSSPPLVGTAKGSHLHLEGFNMSLVFFGKDLGTMLLGLCKGILALSGILSGNGFFTIGIQPWVRLFLLTDDLEWNELAQLHP